MFWSDPDLVFKERSELKLWVFVMTKAVSRISVLLKQFYYCANTGTFH